MRAQHRILLILSMIGATACQRGVDADDARVLQGPESFLDGYPAIGSDGLVNVVVEIPAGTNDKWEVDKKDGSMRWEIRDGKPRVVAYLGYPANYGMVPRTVLPKTLGGDGDPLDVLLLGPAQPRGSVVKGRVLGVLKLLDGGERDDKLILVLEDAPLVGLNTLQDLDAKYPGVTSILETWMTNYKGPGKLVSEGYAGVEDARRILTASIQSYEARATSALKDR